MVNKWLVYGATYITYSVVHSIRTCWASLKTVFIAEPYDFSDKYLGALDMYVLFTIAILLNVFGGEVEKYSRRKLLFIMMGSLIANLLLLFILILKQVQSGVVYFIFYGASGYLSCFAWPICLYVGDRLCRRFHNISIPAMPQRFPCGAQCRNAAISLRF